jgi:hypothetical protein
LLIADRLGHLYGYEASNRFPINQRAKRPALSAGTSNQQREP